MFLDVFLHIPPPLAPPTTTLSLYAPASDHYMYVTPLVCPASVGPIEHILLQKISIMQLLHSYYQRAFL